MKVIFLDVDGVLNSLRSCVALGGFPWPGAKKEREWEKFDDVAIGLLQRVVRKTGAVCVLSSTWRLGFDDFTDLQERLGVPIIGKTRDTWGSEKRGHQIKDWLDAHPEVASWAILDDDSDMLPDQMSRFVKVNHDDGFSYEQHRALIEMLGEVQE